MIDTPPLSPKVRHALALVWPQLARDTKMLDLQIRMVYEDSYLPVTASDDELVRAAADLQWSRARMKELEGSRIPESGQSQLERACLVAFKGDRRAATLLLQTELGQRIGIDDAAYLNKMRIQKALCVAWRARCTPATAPIPSENDLAHIATDIRRTCKLPDLPCERLCQVIEEWASLRKEQFWLVLDSEENSWSMDVERRARHKAISKIYGDEHAVDLYTRLLLGQSLNDHETAYLNAELARLS